MSNKHNNNDEEYFFDEEVGSDDNDLNDFFSDTDSDADNHAEGEVKDSESLDEHAEEKDAVNASYEAGESELKADYPEQKQSLMGSVKGFASKHVRIVSVAGVAVVALIGFQIFHSSSSKEKAFMTQPAAPVVQQAVAPAPVPAPVVVHQVSAASKKQLLALKNQLIQSKNQMNVLQSKLMSIHNTQKDTEMVMSALTEKLQTVTASNQQLKSEVKLLKKYQQDQKKKREYKKTHYVRYHIEALEEGRAWLMGSNGLRTTVAVGNTLAHYGKVLAVNVDHGVIVMSSGDNITYKPQVSASAATK